LYHVWLDFSGVVHRGRLVAGVRRPQDGPARDRVPGAAAGAAETQAAAVTARATPGLGSDASSAGSDRHGHPPFRQAWGDQPRAARPRTSRPRDVRPGAADAGATASLRGVGRPTPARPGLRGPGADRRAAQGTAAAGADGGRTRPA